MGRHLHRALAPEPPPPASTSQAHRTRTLGRISRFRAHPFRAHARARTARLCARSPVLTSARPSSSRAVIMATMVQISTDTLKNINDTNAPSPGKVAEPKKRATPDEVEGKEKKESPEKKAKEATDDQEKQETEAPVGTDTDLKDADFNEAKEGVEAEAEPKEPVIDQAPAKDADVNEVKEGVETEPKEPVVEAPAKASCVVY